MRKIDKFLKPAYLSVLLYLPFHALISTWLIRTFAHAQLFKAWKDIVLFTIFAIVLWTYRKFWLRQVRAKLIRVMLLYAVFVVVYSLASAASNRAIAAGLIIDLRFIASFCIAYTLAAHSKVSMKSVLPWIAYPALVATLFGLLQAFVLPKDFLTHFGYGKDIIPAYFLIDNNPSLVRILSTLRGPNQLGAYMVFAGPLLGYLSWKKYLHRHDKFWLGVMAFLTLGSCVVLYESGSRSAWIGLSVTVAYLFGRYLVDSQRKLLLGLVVALGCVLAGLTYMYRSTDFVSRQVLHSDPSDSSQIDSNDGHFSSIRASLRRIGENPLGSGVGTVGPASVYNYSSGPVVENQYLLITEEIGVFGGVLFILVVAGIAKRLYIDQAEHSQLALGVWLGISAICLLLPAWADETLAVIVWGVAGVITGVSLANKTAHARVHTRKQRTDAKAT